MAPIRIQLFSYPFDRPEVHPHTAGNHDVVIKDTEAGSMAPEGLPDLPLEFVSINAVDSGLHRDPKTRFPARSGNPKKRANSEPPRIASLKKTKEFPSGANTGALGKIHERTPLFAGYGRNKAFSTAGATALEHFLAVGRCHACAETVGFCSLLARGLECAFHDLILFTQNFEKPCFTGSGGYLSTKLSTKPFVSPPGSC